MVRNMKKITENKREKIFFWNQVGIPCYVIALATKLSEPTVREIIRQENSKHGPLAENPSLSHRENVVKQGYPFSQIQLPNQIPVLPEDTAYPNSTDYRYQCSVENQMRMKAEEELRREREHHREELRRRDQERDALTQQLTKKIYTINKLENKNNTLSEQLNKEYRRYEELQQNYNQMVQKATDTVQQKVNYIALLEHQIDQLKHTSHKNKVENRDCSVIEEPRRQPLDMDYPRGNSIHHLSSSQNVQSNEGEPAHQELNAEGKNSQTSTKNPILPTTQLRKKNTDIASGIDYKEILVKSFIKGTSAFLNDNNQIIVLPTSDGTRCSEDQKNNGWNQMFNIKDLIGNTVPRYLPDGIVLGCPYVAKKEQ